MKSRLLEEESITRVPASIPKEKVEEKRSERSKKRDCFIITI
jgi:hypothetical protein